MRGKRFRTKRLWYNTHAWMYMGGGLVLAGLIGSFTTGKILYILFGAGLAVIGMVVAVSRDKRRESIYTMGSSELVLKNSSGFRRIPLDTIADASLLDRSGARNYISQLTRGETSEHMDVASRKSIEDEFVRFCSVDIGLRSLTFGVGRRLIDQLPNAKNDLVLLRLRDGSNILLSPHFNQDLVDSISRALRAVAKNAV